MIAHGVEKIAVCVAMGTASCKRSTMISDGRLDSSDGVNANSTLVKPAARHASRNPHNTRKIRPMPKVLVPIRDCQN